MALPLPLLLTRYLFVQLLFSSQDHSIIGWPNTARVPRTGIIDVYVVRASFYEDKTVEILRQTDSQVKWVGFAVYCILTRILWNLPHSDINCATWRILYA